MASLKFAFTAAALAVPVSGLHAAVSFSENFDSNSIGTNFVITDAVGASMPDFSSGAAAFPGAGDSGRSYIGTVATDFADNNFTASVDITIVPGGSNARGFIGLGPGIVGGDGTGGSPSFGEPSVGPVLFGTFNSNGRDTGQVNSGDFNTGTINNISVVGTDIGTTPVGDGTHTITLEWNATTSLLTWSRQSAGDAAPVLIGTQDGSDNGFTSSDARIFLGGNNGTSFDNFSVTVTAVPEPSATALLGILGLLGIARRRR